MGTGRSATAQKPSSIADISVTSRRGSGDGISRGQRQWVGDKEEEGGDAFCRALGEKRCRDKVMI